MARLQPRDRVGVVGTGMVGASFAYALIQSGLANELILIDADAARAEGEAMDLSHGLPFVGSMRIRAGGYELLAGCDLVVITAGANQRPGQSRLDLLKTNAAVIRDIVPRVVAANPTGVILVASNPVDILTQIAADHAGLPPGHVFGSGTILDTARFRYLLGEHLGVNSQSVHAYILAEHGDSAVPVWSTATIAGVPLMAPDRPDVPAAPTGVQFASVWHGDLIQLGANSIGVTLRYDDTFSPGIAAGNVQLWTYDGWMWQDAARQPRRDRSPDQRHRRHHRLVRGLDVVEQRFLPQSINPGTAGLTSSSPAIGVEVPEPTSLSLIALATTLLLPRRRPNLRGSGTLNFDKIAEKTGQICKIIRLKCAKISVPDPL